MYDDTPPAGWYPDPLGRAPNRWWNGSTWTEQVSDDAISSRSDNVTGSARPAGTAPPAPAYGPPGVPRGPTGPPVSPDVAYASGAWHQARGMAPSPYMPAPNTAPWRKGGTSVIFVIFALFFCAPIGLVLVWTQTDWTTRTKTLITLGLVAFTAIRFVPLAW